ncbi:hypothetical protein F7725_017717 [Dissostichus mawsoni]|uniref:Uncharacterized protein n=1 Tax=Dissostichus mawsoni TaxID=36200 RepID=A0A7J5XPQ4_DISMA|nr:hypothetical protein F7725_017717 [Dissostichus mawsoni]
MTVLQCFFLMETVPSCDNDSSPRSSQVCSLDSCSSGVLRGQKLGGETLESRQHQLPRTRRLSVQLPILHLSYLPGGVSASSSSTFQQDHFLFP